MVSAVEVDVLFVRLRNNTRDLGKGDQPCVRIQRSLQSILFYPWRVVFPTHTDIDGQPAPHLPDVVDEGAIRVVAIVAERVTRVAIAPRSAQAACVVLELVVEEPGPIELVSLCTDRAVAYGHHIVWI